MRKILLFVIYLFYNKKELKEGFFMAKTLVLTEKPSVGRDIAKILRCNQKGNGYLMGEKFIVTWAMGHLVTLAEPHAYGDKYKSWRLETLPMIPQKMDLVVIKQTAKQYSTVRNLMKREDVQSLVIATDSGREGELVARWIMTMARWKKPAKRLWISSQTDRAILEGFNNLKPAKEYDNLYKSAQCRAEADWLVGLNTTRALTCKYNAQLSAGRVQTPTLALIVQREEERRKFIPKEYWSISALFKGISVKWQDKKSKQNRTFDKDVADAIVAKVKDKKGKITEVKKEAKKELPPLLYDLTELQRDANRRFNYSAKKTLSIMQRLYESHKLVTYPRTDSKHITDDMVNTLPERLKSISVGPYKQYAQDVLKKKTSITKRIVDNSKVTDHHAIIPTEQYVNLSSLSSEERNIYDLIVRRFIAAQNPAFEYEQTTVKIESEGEVFIGRGKIVKSQGWKALYDKNMDIDDEDEEESANALPPVKKGEEAKMSSPKTISAKTKPPARYNEATLLSAMEHPGKFIEDKGLREAIESTSGLGTPATRADIIEKLFKTYYIERKGKEIVPTSKGIQLIKIVPEDLKLPELTAKWEQQLNLISRGKEKPDLFIDQMKKYASKLVSTVIASSYEYKHDNLTREKCPDCGKYLLDVNGKKGRMYVCSDRKCGFRKSVSQQSNARCPVCHKNMEIVGDNENKMFVCSCGHREKLEEYKKRKNERVNKKEIGKILKNQKKDEPINTALADALSKWKK